MDKVINPISKKPITIGGGVYNKLLNQGYIFKKGELVKEAKEKKEKKEKSKRKESSEESNEIIEEIESSGEYENESTDESGEYEYESIEEIESDDEKPKNKNKYDYDDFDFDESVEYNQHYNYTLPSGNKRPSFEKIDTSIETFDLPHVRCIECNKPIAGLHKQYVKLSQQGMEPIDIYEKLNIKRNCCRMHITHTSKEILNIDDDVNIITNKTKTLKLTKNPIISKPIDKSSYDIIRLYEGDQFQGIKKKTTFGKNNEYVKYEDFRQPELLKKKPMGKYYVSYAK